MILKNICKEYNDDGFSKKALKNININFKDKGLVFILGKSGSGKSSLLNIIGGIDRPTAGEVIIGGRSLWDLGDDLLIDYRNSYCGFIFQEYNLLEDLNAYDNIKLSLELLGNNIDLASKYLNMVGLAGYEHKMIRECSGGEKQRIAIARALIRNPKVILCDEPTAALDSKNSKEIMELLKKLSLDRLIIVVSHNEALAEAYSDDIVRISDGEIIESTLLDNSTSTNESLELKESKLGIKTKLKLSLIGMHKHPIRFTSNIILLSLSFLLLIFSLLIIFSPGNLVYANSLKHSDSSYLEVNKSYNDNFINLNNNDISYFKDSNINSIGVVDEALAIENVNYNSELYYYNIMPTGYSFISFLDEGLPIKGRLPNKNNEIIITNLLDEVISHNGLIDKKIKTVLNENLIIGDTAYLVTGIVDTKFSDKFEVLKNKNDEALAKSLINYLDHDISSLIFLYNENLNNKISLGKSFLSLNDNVNSRYTLIEGISDSYSYKSIDKDGVLVPASTIIESLKEISFKESYNGLYYESYYSLFMDLLKNDSSDRPIYQKYYDVIASSFTIFEKAFNNMKVKSLDDKLEYNVIGVFDGGLNQELLLMSSSLFDPLYSRIGGAYNRILIDKSSIRDYQDIIEIKNSDIKYIVEKELLANIDSYNDLMIKIELPAIILATTLLFLSASLFIIYINQALVDKSNLIAVLKMLGCSNRDMYSIAIITALPILIFTGLISILLSIPLFNYFIIIIKSIYNISMFFNVMAYIIVLLALIILFVASIMVSIRKMNKLSILEVFHFE